MNKFIYLFILVLILKSTFALDTKVIEVNNQLSISSLDNIETKVYITIDSSISTPKVSINHIKGSIESLDDVVYFKDNTIHLGDVKTMFNLGSSDETLSSSNRLGFNLISLVGIFMVSLFTMKSTGSNFKLLLLFGVFSLIYIHALDVTGVGLDINIRVPIGYSFEKLDLQLKNAQVDLQSLIVANLVINNCIDTMADDSIFIKSLYVSKSLKICSNNNVMIDGFNHRSDGASYEVKSTNGDVSVKVAGDYKGSIKFTAASAPSMTGSCDYDSSTSMGKQVITGSCADSIASSFTIDAPNGEITWTSNIPSGSCPTTASWRESAQPFDGPVSPPIPASTPAVNTVYSSLSDWRLMEDSDTIVVLDQGAIKVPLAKWGPADWFLCRTGFTSTLTKDLVYKFSFDFKLGAALSGITITKVSVVILDYPWGPFNVTRGWGVAESEIQQEFISPDTFTSLDWVSRTITIQPTNSFRSGMVLGLRVKMSAGSGDTLPVFYFRNMTFTTPTRSSTPSGLITADSKVVTLRKPSTSLQPQDYSLCPHLQSGLKHWHDPSTWPGASVPLPNSVITLPANTKVLVSSCSLSTDTYQKIIVPATSELIFSDAPIVLNVKDIYVEGKFYIGSKDCRLNSTVQVNFYGAKTTTDTISSMMGSKGIGVSKTGFLSINGKQYHNTWSRLAQSAFPGDTLIFVQDNINWEVGQEVVLTTSTWKDEFTKQNEVRKISAIQGKKVLLDKPLNFLHFASEDYQVEVGLLSRRIVFKSMDGLNDFFGGHVLMMGEGQISGLQLINMGQQNIKARYPLHFHLAKTLTSSYISDCSVYQSFYRCFTIHGTNNVNVERNVAYDVYGHCYYLEDGVEENNTIAYNLAAYVHTIGTPAAGEGQPGEMFYESAALRQPADSAAGGFYITNAYNRIYGNAASGGWASYSFPNLKIPIGFHSNLTSINPSSRTTLEFDGNSAHSSGYHFWFGSCIYVGGNLSTQSDGTLAYKSGRVDRDTVDYNNPQVTVWMRFSNIKVSLCSSGIGHWGNTIEVVKYESHDNKVAGTVFGEALLDQALVNAKSANIEVDKSLAPNWGFQFYDTWTHTILTNIKWKNFHPRVGAENPHEDNKIIVSMTHSDIYKPQGISAVKNFTFDNCDVSQYVGHRIQDTGASRYFNYVDFDGSSVGSSGTPKLIGSHSSWWNYSSSCQFQADWNAYYCNKVSGQEVVNIDVEAPGLIDPDVLVDVPNNSIRGKTTLFKYGQADQTKSAVVTSNVGITGISNVGWYLYLNNSSPASFRIHTRLIPYGTYILLAIRYPAGTLFNINTFYQWDYQNSKKFILSQGASADVVLQGNGKQYYYFDGQHLYIKLVNHLLTGASTEYFERNGVKIYSISTGFYYIISATCPGGNCAVSDVYPSFN
ncbi:hypothetical protein DLAC_05595 [Tieghemostelium lacteum]|uniref:G8 domain-containing protein n=1 Tax=Tieghemostelium lacteum TaxID=361077 RepID=A0A151ZG92_TIELA|nr:hypothetical protein DLAC_05595 [Tieghemostelium lacteum]|eukprot:KYQ92991.1 hypothetical protein DLAC_05595 [Tieghemostelium lacteum]